MFLEALKNNGCGVGDQRNPVEVHVTCIINKSAYSL